MEDTALAALDNPVTVDSDPPETTTPDIPSDWVKDRTTGQYRPPKRRGRKRTPEPPPDAHEPITREADTPPDSASRGRNAKGVPRWKAGVIARGMAKFYRRTGKIIKAMDRDIGIAVIESADDCGEAWDELARTNPRIRAALLKMITGGSWMALFWAHAPIFMAVMMKDRIRKHIPFGKLLESALEPDEDGSSDIADIFGGITPDDMQQAMNLTQGLMGQMGLKFDGKGTPVAEDEQS